jgi:Fe-S cluster assembly protein SufD
MTALPTRRDEDFRYADLAALAPLWPVSAEEFMLDDGESGQFEIIVGGDVPVARLIVITLSAHASFDLRILNAGAASGRIEVSVLLADNANFTMGAAQIAGGAQTVEVVTQVHHQGENATSRQVVRSVLGGQATGSYLGKVHVARGADGTDGEQSVRAMLLTRTATANARPELEIYADDVKCAHGCAVGELDADGLFYMASRGLPPELAKRLMLQAFLAEAFVGARGADDLNAAAVAALEALL